MPKLRRKFSREFKLRAIELSYERESLVALAEELDIRPSLLYRWRTEFKADKSGSFPGEGHEALSPEVLRIRKLEQQLRAKEQELEILKKAIGIFSTRDGISIDL